MITKEYLQQELAKRIGGYKHGVETTTDNIIAEMKSILVLVDALQDRVKDYDEALKKARMYRDNAKAVEEYAAATRYENIFPELRESEDEKIRKEAISIVQSYMNICDKEGDPCLSGYKVLDWLEKQKEPKPAIWTEEDEKNLCELLAYGETRLGLRRWIAGLPEKIKGLQQKPAEWSEEDETTIEGACSVLEVYGHTKLASMLKSLRPQPKQGLVLTEEQEKKFGHLFSRPSWKPSDEQMNCLCAVVDAAIRKHNESVSGYEPARVLKSLYEDLQKLM